MTVTPTPPTPLWYGEEDSGLFVIICQAVLPDEVYALNMQLSTLRKKTHSPVKGTYLL